ncbi:MAG: hypothetical protein ABIL58_05505 [Pseudomonadota bacterium]
MKIALQKGPYTTTAATFLVILAVGRVFWGWGAVATAFCLLLYCIVAVAIKLDDIAQRLDSLSEQVRRLTTATDGTLSVAQQSASHITAADAGSPDAKRNP